MIQRIQTQINKICLCRKPDLITTQIEGEIICNNCGVVIGYDEFHDIKNRINADHLSKTSLDIFQQRQLGTHPQDSRDVVYTKNLKIEKNNSTLAEFTDVCKKLYLPNFVSENAWKLFCKLKSKKKVNDSFTRAKFVCIAIYQTCQNHAIPYDEKRLQEIVKKSLNVKNVPKMQNIAFKQQSRFIDCAASSPRKPITNSKEKFYLNLYVSQAQREHNIFDISQLKRLSFQYYDSDMERRKRRSSADQSCHYIMMISIDHNSIAKRAVNKALLRCCAS